LAEIRARLADTAIEDIPSAILDAAFRFGEEVPWADDATVVVLRRSAS
jgi:hypothetical protein